MKSFTGIIFWSILLICSACTDENETNNGKRTDCYNGTPLTVLATATGFENISGSEKPSTRASVTDEHLKTEFVDGDSIGIFSIKDGTIVDDINNIPLVYNVSNDSWNPVENSKTLYWYDGASYIAYYPYRKNITLDVSKDTDEAIASLTRNEKLQPSKDQSTKEKHTVSDLLIATGVPTTGNSSGIILNLQFKHQFTLLVLQPQAYIGCFAPENAGFVYHKESRILGTDSAAINVNLNGITPYQIDSVKFCAIVPSQKNARITGSYVTADGYENTLSFSDIKNLSSDKIKAALSASPAAVSANIKGKLIRGYTWYFVGVVNKSDATKLNDGDSVTLRCDNMSRDGINATVYYRGPINTDETVLILSSKIMDSDIARLRTEDVEIVINETDGIRINKSAVRVVNGVQGVYVLTGNIVRFKKLDVIYTGDDYVVSKMIKEDTYDKNKVPYLKIYDAVILEGKDLKDGKLISY